MLVALCMVPSNCHFAIQRDTMPGKKQSKNGKVQKRKQGGGFGTLMLAQTPAIRVKLPWSWGGTITETVASAGSSYTFGINNCYDPNFTGAGAQPLGFDQYSALYARYRVLRVRYRVTFAQRGTIPCRIGCYASPQSTLPADSNAWTIQNSTAKQSFLGTTTGGNNVYVFTGTLLPSRVFGVTQNEYLSDQDFAAGTGFGPARLCYLHIWNAAVAGGASLASTDYSVSLWFETEMSSPVALSMS